jgi:hypothetical protein
MARAVARNTLRTFYLALVLLAFTLFIPAIPGASTGQPISLFQKNPQCQTEQGTPLPAHGTIPSDGISDREDVAVPFNILEDIKRGQEFLENKSVGSSLRTKKKTVKVACRKKRGRKKTNTKIVIERSISPNFLLAVEDLDEQEIRQVRVTASGCMTDGFQVKTIRVNGVGSRFEVTYPDDMVILALRTTVRAGKGGFEEVVYTPYSPQIDTPEVRDAGIRYLAQQIELARRDLQDRRVRLAGFDMLGSDIPADVSLALSIIEHIDPGRFKSCPRGQEISLIHEVLTIIGANTVNAYAYSRSPAGAMGLFQIMPATYKTLLRAYPMAGLNRDFVAGCKDHVNAAKASLLLFDHDLQSLPRDQVREVAKSLKATGMYLAASYNCGPKRVEKSIRKCGNDAWTCHLPTETKIYLEKFDSVWDWGIPTIK